MKLGGDFMKKWLCLFLSVLCLMFTACSCKTEKQTDYKNSVIDSDIIDTSSKIKPKNPLSKDEVKKIFEPLLSNAIKIQETILNDNSEYTILDNTPVIINGNRYFLIEHSQFKSVEDVWEFAYTAYTKEAAKRIFYDRLDPKGMNPRFIEKDGKLYYDNGAHGYVVKYPIDTLEIIEQYEDTVIVSIDYCCYDYEPEKSVYIMCKTETGWKLCNSEDEALYKLPKQFLE